MREVDPIRVVDETVEGVGRGFMPLQMLDVIQARIAGATSRELEAIASKAVVEVPLSPPAEAHRSKAKAALPVAGETWTRVELAPGVELFVKGDASASSKRIAREILETYLSTDSD
jgi:hypothetical protein